MNIIEDVGDVDDKAFKAMLTLINAVPEYEQQQAPVTYKQGDLVVLTDPEASDSIAIFGEIDPMGNYWLEWQSGGEFCVFNLKELRPATEQEKLVGHRV